MTWRTLVISTQAKLSYKNNYVLIKNEETQMIHISELYMLLIESTACTITAYLLVELMKRKVKVVFCDERRFPLGEVIPYRNAHNSTKKILQQINWENEDKLMVWTEVIRQKIKNQTYLLDKLGLECKDMNKYVRELQFADTTNREGHAAKVYFNQLFGKIFTRELDNDINAALNYGYSILLSAFCREIVALGFLTQIGFKHKSEYNPYNLACDLMEPFRIIIDEFVYLNQDQQFNETFKYKLVDLLNQKIAFDGLSLYLSNSIGIYVKSIFLAVEQQDLTLIKAFEFE